PLPSSKESGSCRALARKANQGGTAKARLSSCWVGRRFCFEEGSDMAQQTVEQAIEAIREQAFKAVEEANDTQALEAVRVEYLGKKGQLTRLLRGMGELSAEERPVVGKRVNELRDALTHALEERMSALA